MRAIATLTTLMFLAAVAVAVTPTMEALSTAEEKDLVTASLVADVSPVQVGKPFTVGVLLKIKPDWHIYWRNPGQGGMATEVKFGLPKGYSVGPLAWPRPLAFKMPGNITQYGYKDHVLLTAQVTPPEKQQVAPVSISAEVSWLACKGKCIIGKDSLQLAVNVVREAKEARPANTKLFATWAAKVDPLAASFALKDQGGMKVSLTDLRGKTVVLEWFNPDCPFVKRHYAKGTMVSLAKKYAPQGVVWLAVNSTHYMDAAINATWHNKWKMPFPVLVDQDGAVGRAYGAQSTPHIFVISPEGRIVYQGAIDDDPRGRNKKIVNYVDRTLTQLLAGEPVSEPQTRPYGCSVKYAKKEK